jgi:hypothetical protein
VSIVSVPYICLILYIVEKDVDPGGSRVAYSRLSIGMVLVSSIHCYSISALARNKNARRDASEIIIPVRKEHTQVSSG